MRNGTPLSRWMKRMICGWWSAFSRSHPSAEKCRKKARSGRSTSSATMRANQRHAASRLVLIHRRIPLERIFDCIGVKDTASVDPDRGGVFFQRSFRNCKKLKVTIQNAVMLPQSGCVLDRAGCFRTGQGKTVYVIFSDQGHGGHKKGQITGENIHPRRDRYSRRPGAMSSTGRKYPFAGSGGGLQQEPVWFPFQSTGRTLLLPRHRQ